MFLSSIFHENDTRWHNSTAPHLCSLCGVLGFLWIIPQSTSRVSKSNRTSNAKHCGVDVSITAATQCKSIPFQMKWIRFYCHVTAQSCRYHSAVSSGVTGGRVGGSRGQAGAGGQSAPLRLLTRKFLADLLGKKREGKKGKRGEMEKNRRKIVKRKVEYDIIWYGKLKLEVGKVTNEERTFFFLAFHFSKRLKFVLGLPKRTKMEIFYREKAFHAGKKSGKMTLPPQKNFPVSPLAVRQHNANAMLVWTNFTLF